MHVLDIILKGVSFLYLPPTCKYRICTSQRRTLLTIASWYFLSAILKLAVVWRPGILLGLCLVPPNDGVPQILTSIFNCLGKVRKEFRVPIDKCLETLIEWRDILVVGELQSGGAVVDERFLFHTLTICKCLLEFVRGTYLSLHSRSLVMNGSQSSSSLFNVVTFLLYLLPLFALCLFSKWWSPCRGWWSPWWCLK